MRTTLRWQATLAAAFAMTIANILAAPVAAQTAPIVSTSQGKVQGAAEAGVAVFRGIPFAAAPVGDLRWREPFPPPKWDGVRKADEFGASCIQSPQTLAFLGAPTLQSEDCLLLNIWTPKAATSAKLPVMVWIYGGAFVGGTSAAPGYDGAPLARRGAVMVSFNYRLGQLGFFVHPALEKENPAGPANFGLLDQIAALKWVQLNIAQFGGDPNNVTIFGESAGARSVLALFASPRARGLFQRGIAQSTYLIPDATRAKASDVGVSVAAALGFKGGDATMAQLRAIPATAFVGLGGTDLSLAPVPVSGDEVLPQSVQDIFAAHEEAPLPLIVGSNSDDISVAAEFGIKPEDVIARVKGAGLAVNLLYPGIQDSGERARQVTRDVVFTLAVRWIADLHSRVAPTWRYYFNYVAVKARPAYPKGAPHGGDIAYFMDTGDVGIATKDVFGDADRAVARRAADYWFSFALTGTPDPGSGAAWPKHDRRADRTMVFAGTSQALLNFMRHRLNVLKGLVNIVGSLLNRK